MRTAKLELNLNIQQKGDPLDTLKKGVEHLCKVNSRVVEGKLSANRPMRY